MVSNHGLRRGYGVPSRIETPAMPRRWVLVIGEIITLWGLCPGNPFKWYGGHPGAGALWALRQPRGALAMALSMEVCSEPRENGFERNSTVFPRLRLLRAFRASYPLIKMMGKV